MEGKTDNKPKFDKAIYCEHPGQSLERSLRLNAKNSYASGSVPGSVTQPVSVI